MKFLNLRTILLLGLLVWQSSAVAQTITDSQWQVPLKNAQQTTTFSHYKGQVVWLDFWASWCPPCRESFPWMEQMQQKYAGQGLKVVAINVDENTGDATDFLRQHSADFSVFFDPKGIAPEAFSIQGMPTSLLIDRQGQVRLVHVGFEDHQKDALEAKIVAVLNGR